MAKSASEVYEVELKPMILNNLAEDLRDILQVVQELRQLHKTEVESCDPEKLKAASSGMFTSAKFELMQAKVGILRERLLHDETQFKSIEAILKRIMMQKDYELKRNSK